MSLEQDYERYVGPIEDDFNRRVGWQIEIEKIVLSQLFTLNWAALIAVPTLVAAMREKSEIIKIAAAPMAAFAIALILAIICGFLAYRGYGRSAQEADENANALTVRIQKAHTGKHPIDSPFEPQFAGSDRRASEHRKAGEEKLRCAEWVALSSFISFIIGSGMLAYNLSQ